MKSRQIKKSLLTMLFRYLRNLFAVIGVLFVIYHLFFEVSVIYSNSMAPTLVGDESSVRDYILTEKVSYLFRKPRRWEIVNFITQDELGTDVMKRVAGLPGESISIQDHWIHINGKPLDRPSGLDFLYYYATGNLNQGRQFECDNGYFVLGDDSFDSYDSRITDSLYPESIIGRAWMIVWPPSRIRFLTP